MQPQTLVLGVLVILLIGAYFNPPIEISPSHSQTNETPLSEQNEDVLIPTNENVTEPDVVRDDIPTESENVNSEESVVCASDVKVCTGGGFGEPSSTTYLQRVPPSCEFPECPG